MDNQNSSMTEAERVKLQRDIAINQAAENAVDRNIAEAHRDALASDNAALRDETRAAKTWAASNAAARANAERDAAVATGEARSSGAAMMILAGVVVILVIVGLLYYSNQQQNVAETPPITRVINTTTPAPSAPVVQPQIVVNDATPATVVHAAPAQSTPASPAPTVVLNPPSMATGGSNQSSGGNSSGTATDNGNGANNANGSSSGDNSTSQPNNSQAPATTTTGQ